MEELPQSARILQPRHRATVFTISGLVEFACSVVDAGQQEQDAQESLGIGEESMLGSAIAMRRPGGVERGQQMS